MTGFLGVKERFQNSWLLGLGLALGALLLLAPGAEAGILDVAWNAPTTSEDGSPLTDLSSYLVYFGPSSSPCSGSSFELVAAATPIPSPGEVITHRLTGLTTGMSYSVQVTAVDTSGNESACSNEIVGLAQPTPDTTPPQVPSELTATAVSSSEITLAWNAATDDVEVTGYRVYRDGAQIALVTATSYQDAGLSASTTFSYTVAAYDAAGNLSPRSTAVSATTQAAPDTTPPLVPTGLSATAVSSSQITLAWTAATDDVAVTGYRISRDGAQIATVATTSYQDTGLAPATTYSYTVAAHDAAANVSQPSAPVSASTQASNTTSPGTPKGPKDKEKPNHPDKPKGPKDKTKTR